jgi:hypothetical protein
MNYIIIIINHRLAWRTYIPSDADLYAGNAPPNLIIIIIITIIIEIMKFETLAQHCEWLLAG